MGTDDLKQISLCRAPDRDAARKLLALAREISFVKGARLVRQNEPARGAFLIRKGDVEASVALPGGSAQAAELEAALHGQIWRAQQRLLAPSWIIPAAAPRRAASRWGRTG